MNNFNTFTIIVLLFVRFSPSFQHLFRCFKRVLRGRNPNLFGEENSFEYGRYGREACFGAHEIHVSDWLPLSHVTFGASVCNWSNNRSKILNPKWLLLFASALRIPIYPQLHNSDHVQRRLDSRPQSIMGIERLIPRVAFIDCWLSRSDHLSSTKPIWKLSNDKSGD